MCGIAGIVQYDCERIDTGLVRQMIQVIRHRGPDGEGVIAEPSVALGHVRLSILDLEGSPQPMTNQLEDSSLWIVYNGEIYNFQQIREDLISKGHIFHSKGDTEVLIHLYQEYSEKMLDYLNGMFAFAIWDKKKQELFLARDRMGIKPLYYSWAGDCFLFASEPKAILQHPQVSSRADPESIWHYMTYRSVPAPHTLFEQIKKLRAGHYLRLNRTSFQDRQYWDIPLVEPQAKVFQGASIPRCMQEAESHLLKSVERRLISDVPFGAFLSGGVDSSLIVAMMAKLCSQPVRTYSVGFRDFPNSELDFAKIVARQFKTEHHELVLEPDCFADYLDKLTWMRDSPLSERSDVPLHLLSLEARKEVKILLSGEGSDELYAGYPKYAYDRFAPWFHWIPRNLVDWGCSILPSKLRKVEIAFNSLAQKNEAERWTQWFSPFTTAQKNQLFNTPFPCPNPTEQYRKNSRISLLDRMLYTDCKLWLAENLLERGDRMTMAASIEGRVPFLDHEFVELAFQMPDSVKVHGMKRKWLIKQLALKYLPKEIVTRKKVGFEVPLAQWFRGKLKDMCYDRICRNDGLMKDLFSRQSLLKILDDHCSGKKDNFLQIWTLLGLSIWEEQFRAPKKTGLSA